MRWIMHDDYPESYVFMWIHGPCNLYVLPAYFDGGRSIINRDMCCFTEVA